MKSKVLFVCLGNICRSPLAKALFDKHVKEAGKLDQFVSESAGTANYHVGQTADRRTISNARKNGLEMNHRARQFQKEDFQRFDYIVVMDKSNFSEVSGLTTELHQQQKIHLMRKWDEKHQNMDVPDPWFGGEEGFQKVFEILNHCTSSFLESFDEII